MSPAFVLSSYSLSLSRYHPVRILEREVSSRDFRDHNGSSSVGNERIHPGYVLTVGWSPSKSVGTGSSGQFWDYFFWFSRGGASAITVPSTADRLGMGRVPWLIQHRRHQRALRDGCLRPVFSRIWGERCVTTDVE